MQMLRARASTSWHPLLPPGTLGNSLVCAASHTRRLQELPGPEDLVWSKKSILLKILFFFLNTEFNGVVLASLELAMEEVGPTESHLSLFPKCWD